MNYDEEGRTRGLAVRNSLSDPLITGRVGLGDHLEPLIWTGDPGNPDIVVNGQRNLVWKLLWAGVARQTSIRACVVHVVDLTVFHQHCKVRYLAVLWT